MAGIGIPIADTAMFVANKAVAKMTNVVAERNERAKDSLFAEKHGVSLYEYRSSDYERLGFDNLDDLHQFVEAMKGEGVTVASTYYKYNGQYLVEMPKTLESGRTSTELIANYERSTGYSVQNAKEEYHDKGTEITNAPAGFMREVFTKHIDGWNEMFGGVSNLWHWSEAYKYADETKGTDIFKRKANNDGEISMSAKVGANSQKAIVLNNDTVVINGEIVRDAEIRKNILLQHEERMKAVHEEKNYRDSFAERRQSHARESKAIHSGAVGYNDTADTVGRLTAKKMNMGLSEQESQELERAQKRLAEFEKYSGYDFAVTIRPYDNDTYTYTYKNITDKDFRAYNETMLKSIEDSGYAIRARGGVFDAEAFKAIGTEELAKIGITPTLADTIVDVNTGIRKLNPRAELAERIKENAFRQEYSYEAHKPDPLKETVFSHWSFGSLADITRELNETNVAFRVSNNEKLLSGFTQEELDIFHKQLKDAGVSESVLYTDKEYAIEKLEQLYKTRLAWIDNRLAEIDRLKAGIDTSTKKGQEQYAKLSQEERELRDKKADIAMHRNSAQDIVKALEVAWTSKDSVMIDARTKAILNDLTKSEMFAGLSINLAKMEMRDLLKINKAFLDKATELNYKFIKAGGKFDIKALKSLSARELQEVFGISTHTRDMLVRINEKGSWGKTGGYGGMAYKGLMFIMQKDDSDETVAELHNIGKVYEYTKGTIQTIKRSKLINRRDLRHANKEHKSPNKPNKQPKNKKKKSDAEKYKSRQLSEREIKRVKKYEKEMAKKYKQTEAKKQAGKLSKMYQQAQEAVAKSALGKAMTAVSSAIATILLWIAIIFILIPMIIGLVLVIFLFIYWGISSFLNVLNPQTAISNLLAPTTYADTVAWNLYQFLEEQEEDWLKSIDNTSDIFENRATLKYGSVYKTYSEYLATEPRIVEVANSDGTSTMYVNPFRGVANANINKTAMTKVEDFSGVEQYDVLTNVNYYSRLDTDSAIESGHTSNLKDILSMTDVMFEYELDENDDASMTSILGMSPAQINWNAFCEKVKNVFKWIGNGISKLFNPDEENPPFLIVNTFDYKTIQNYASTLFQVSHQNVLILDVVYYDEDRKMYAVVNGVKHDITSTPFAEGYGFCSDAERNDFKIRYVPNTGKVSPYLKDASGAYHYLDSGAFDVEIGMDKLWEGSTEPCVSLAWGDDSATHSAIRGMSNLDEEDSGVGGGSIFGDDKCWTETKTSTALTSTASAYDYSTARMSAMMYASYLQGDDSYDLGDYKDSFQAIIYREDGAITYENSETFTVPEYDEEGNEAVDEEGNPITNTYTVYTVTYRWGYKDTYSYSRSCQGHTFEYCGGHVTVHSQGIVYSTTNEQMAMVGEYADGLAPCTPTFHEDKGSMGYADLVGKVNTETVRYDDNVVTASTSGKAVHPLNHEQGSYAGLQGLNLWVVGEEWSTDDSGIDTSTSYPQYTKDIFDIDTAMRKGKKLFPLSSWKKYEGWTKENMEFVILKMTNDWQSIYGFDVRTEISYIENESPLAVDDINKIVEALKNTYGEDFTSTREEAVRLALGWVNRGHYAEGHSDHDFLSEYCQSDTAYVTVYKDDGTTEYRYAKGNCTAGNDIDFINYIYRYTGASDYGRGGYTSTNLVNPDYSNVLPADVVSHKGIYNHTGNDIEVDVSEIVNKYGIDVYDLFNYSNKEAKVASMRFVETQTTFFVGVLNEDVVLSTGQKIYAGYPIVIDMQRTRIGGTVTLHTKPITADMLTELLISGDDNLYYWIQIPDSRTSYFSYE